MEAIAIAKTKENINTKVVAATILLAIGIAAPYLGSQLITGPIVNATLFLAVVYLGFNQAIFIGLAPSVVALAAGTLPVVLAPMVPFIMLGNIMLMGTFHLLYKRSMPLGALSGAIVKFLFLFATSSVVASLITNKAFAAKASLMMGVFQLITALVGAVIAMSILGLTKKLTKKEI